jgi:hypothetical protein
MSARRPAAFAALLALAAALASCAPEYALYPRLQQLKGGLGPVEVISVASFSPGGRSVDPLRSRELATVMLRAAADGLARRGYVAANDSGTAISCRYDADMRYRVGMSASGGSYASKFADARGSCIAGSASLADPAHAAALARLLRTLRLPGDSGQVPDDSLAQAIDFYWESGARRVLVTETFVRTVSRGTQIVEGIVTGILTMGQRPFWEPSLTVVNVYLIDCPSGSVLWYDANHREASGDPAALEGLMSALLHRLP